jgi:type IV pilus assembly protein PilA
MIKGNYQIKSEENYINSFNNLKSTQKTIQGFTLVELLITIIIVGVLSTIALPSFLNQISRARGSEAKASLGTINRAQQSYRYENGTFAPNLDALKSSGFSINNRYYSYSITGTSNTVTTSADPFQTDLKVYAGGAVMGNNDTFVQTICESINFQGAAADNTASVSLVAGISPSANCGTGRVIQ